MVTDESRYIQRKLYVLNYAKQVGDVKKACRYFGIARSTFYEWKNQNKNGGVEGLARKKTGSVNHPKRTPKPVEDLIIHMRKTYHFGPDRIAMFLARYHQIKISGSGVR